MGQLSGCGEGQEKCDAEECGERKAAYTWDVKILYHLLDK